MDLASPAVSGTSVYANGLMFQTAVENDVYYRFPTKSLFQYLTTFQQYIYKPSKYYLKNP